MDAIERTLASFDGGRVLDVATLEGRFVGILMENLRSYTEIVGIDISERAIEAANEKLGSGDVRFLVMDGAKLDFEDESFDTVCIAASLHHMENPDEVLGEMKRVLKRGGRFIVLEMHRDIETEAERTSSLMHGWAAEIDTALGRVHKPTLTADEIRRHVARLGLDEVRVAESVDRDSDPLEEGKLEMLQGVIERVSKRVPGIEGSEGLLRRGDELARRVREVGAQSEPLLLIAGRKR